MSSIKKCSITLAVIAVVFILSAFVFLGNACAADKKQQAKQQDETLMASISARMDKLSEEKKAAEKNLAVTKKELYAKNKELQSAQSSSKKQNNRIKRLTSEVEAKNKKITELENRIQVLEKEIQELRTRLNAHPQMVSSQEGALSGWHPNAECRVTGFIYKPGDPSVKLKVQYRSGEYADPDPETSETGNDGVQYFVIKGLPAGLQVVVPSGYIVNVDGREDFVAKIDRNNVDGAELDYASNVEYYTDENGDKHPARTFKSGEVFILMKPGGMTIRPPFATAPKR